MKMKIIFITILSLVSFSVQSQGFQKDVFETVGGDLTITFIGHGTLMFEYQNKVIHIDPWSKLADYSKLPKADAIIITHEHGDHLDLAAIEAIEKDGTELILTKLCHDKIKRGKVLQNGDFTAVAGLAVEAVPAYNRLNKKGNGKPYHPKGEGNGYIINFSTTRVYVAGDTEYFPEMKEIKDIAIAFLPMNLPYTMDTQLVAICAKVIEPKILYPYHFGESITEDLVKMLIGSGIDVRIRSMK